ncbi:MAG: type II toxin-antitoxin system YoeB family toxin [Desulfosarcina sp.]|nr:type II toxin-antitoxin system YoeB family toxin [Desulfosarcina sp.]
MAFDKGDSVSPVHSRYGRVDPLQTPPRLGTLTGNPQGCYSRRINTQHRPVYEVFEKTKAVHVLRMS